MNTFTNTVYWCAIISVGSYLFIDYLQKKSKYIFLNPLLFSTLISIVFILMFHIEYETYYEKMDSLNKLLTPATVCLAIPLYRQIDMLKKHAGAIMIGVFSGALASMFSIALLSILFGFSHTMYVTLLPKSVTAAIAMGISEELGGLSSFTVPVVIMTGITGNMIAEKICKWTKITEPIARGVAIGSSSHAMGTSKALEMGETEGAMSSISIAISGVITVILAPLFSKLF